jgi:transposase
MAALARRREMKIVNTHCAGLDVHKKRVTVCALIGEANVTPGKHLRTFRTMTESLEDLAAWLTRLGVRQVAMESTGSYWKPVWAVLEGRFELLLVNAAHVKKVPGRKTDVQDAEWIADLHRHGLVRGSFVPPQEIQDLRDLTRYRVQLTEERGAASNRISKILETANIKLGSVASEVMGVSGRAMVAGLIAGTPTPDELANLARGALRKKMPELREALQGRVRAHHREMLSLLLDQWLYLSEQIAKVDGAIQQRMVPFQWAVSLVKTIPGINQLAAWTILAETGVDMGQFPDEGHFASWAALCPGNNETAGKRLSGTTRDGNRWLQRVMCQVAWAAAHTRTTYYASQFRRLAARRDAKRATIAVAHSILETMYHMLRRRAPYRDLGSDYFERLHGDNYQRYLIRKLEERGYKVTLEPAA